MYFMFAPEEILGQLARADKSETLQGALLLAADNSTQTRDAHENAENAPPRCVVLDEGKVVGFYDNTVPPVQLRRGRSDAERGDVQLSRSVKTDFPEVVTEGQTVSLSVTLVEKTRGKAAVQLAVSPGTKIEVVVLPQRCFALEGEGEGHLVVTDEPETSAIRFVVKATSTGRGKIRILCFQDAQPLGVITLTPEVVAQVSNLEQAYAASVEPLRAPPSTSPDLSLLIFEQEEQDHHTINFRLSASDPELKLNLKPFGSTRLQNPLSYFQEFFKDIESLRLGTDEETAIATRRLELKGADLFKSLLPRDLQTLLWSLRDRVTSVHVQSDEPWIPWELLRLQGEEDGRAVEGQFFCEAFDMTRWFPGVPLRPVLGLGQMAVVVPTDSGLPMAKDELAYLLSLDGEQRTVTEVTASYLKLLGHLSLGVYDGWHFTGHGEFNSAEVNRSRILLEGAQALCPEDISGKVGNCGLPHPLVFLNACQTGRGAMALTGMGGWAKRFIEAGAACFIGSLWSVYDDAAHEFSVAFYKQLLAGDPIGRAARVARHAARRLDNPSWLAYTVFADPLARVGAS